MITLLSRLFIPDYENYSSPKVRQAYGILTGSVGIFFNFFLFVLKIVAGMISHSIAITADAFNNLSDAGSSVITLIGFKMSGQEADSDHPYGHGRIEYLAGLSVSAIILIMAAELAKSSFEKILHPTLPEISPVIFLILVVSILVKFYMYFYNHKIAGAIDSSAMNATASDSFGDVLATFVVLLSSVIGWIFGLAIDGWCGLLVAIFIFYSGVSSARDTINPLLGAAPDPELVEHIEKKAMSYPGVLGVHDLMIHDYGPGSRLVSFHLEMDSKDDVMHSHDVIDRIERDLLVQDGLIATIHFDPVVTGDPHADELKAFLQQEICKLEPLANIHDLRIVPGPTHTNVIFDCAVPAEYMTDKQHRGVKLVSALRNSVQEKWPDHFCVIKLEPDYAPVHHE